MLLETLVPKVHQVTRVQRAYEGDKGHLVLMESWDRRYAFSDYLYICMLCQLRPLPPPPLDCVPHFCFFTSILLFYSLGRVMREEQETLVLLVFLDEG